MNQSGKKNWRDLCAAASAEHDPRKLQALIQDLIRALDERQSQSDGAAKLETPTTNPSSESE